MPRLDGIGVTQAVRTDASSEVPVLMVTASATPSDAAEAQAAGITAMFAKPFLPAQLRDRVGTLLLASSEAPVDRS